MEDVRERHERGNRAPMRRLRVMHVVAALDFGGVESHMKTIAGAAGRLQHDHSFCAIGGGGHVERDLIVSGAPVTCLNAGLRAPSASAFLRLMGHLRAQRPDVVHTHGAEANFHALPAARVLGVPIRIGEEIGIPSHGWKARAAFRFAYRSAHRVLAISEAVAGCIAALGEAPRSKIDVVYPPVMLPEVGQHEQDRRHFTVAFVGRLHPVKNPGIVLPVLKELRDSAVPARLWYLGDGRQRPALEREAERLGLREYVTFCGFVSDIAEVLRRADVMLLPSRSEGLGLAIIEAMALGLPVVVTRKGATPEFVAHGETGYLVDPTDVRDIAEAMRQCWSLGAEGRQQMGRRARDAIKQRFDVTAALETMEAVYNKVARDTGLG